jgi:hypothetical protein
LVWTLSYAPAIINAPAWQRKGKPMNERLHIIHSRGGRIGGRADTQPSDVDAIVDHFAADTRGHLVIHFHGGLVSKAAGLALACRLLVDTPVYAPSATTGGWPVFYVWESGAWETIRNNLTELADEPVFKQLLRKLVQYTIEEVGGQEIGGLGRSIAPAPYGARQDEVRRAFEQFWANPEAEAIPYRHFEILASPSAARAAGSALTEDEIRAELETDLELQRSLATLPDMPPATRSMFAAGAREHRSPFSELVAEEFSASRQARGLVELVRVARFLIKVLRAVLSRRARGRDHGLYATCVEEVVRAFKVAGSGANEWGKALQWNRMKQDTEDAFGPDPNVHAGTALLARLGDALQRGAKINRITLVGHSTGAIYIAHWLAHSAKHLPADLKQDVIFLAPAISFDLWAQTLREHGSRIGRFRMFAMQDRAERDDQVWGNDPELGDARDWRRFVYPSSLLYLVSGILESRRDDKGIPYDEADVPLVGMERYYTGTTTYNSTTGFPEVDSVRAWLATIQHGAVWSPVSGQAAGLNCGSTDHGAFDDEATTLASLEHIVKHTF